MTHTSDRYRGNDTLLFGIILGVLAFWLFAQTTLNIAPAMAAELEIRDLQDGLVACRILWSRHLCSHLYRT